MCVLEVWYICIRIKGTYTLYGYEYYDIGIGNVYLRRRRVVQY